MGQTVSMPLWLFLLIIAFAAVTFASHFLFPSVRWFFRRRAERVVAQLNQRLAKPIEPFKLARRHDMIQRLIYDPQVIAAVAEHAEAEGIPQNVAAEQAERYAREIVPSFSATAYFSVGTRVARWLSRFLYRIRVGSFDRATYGAVDRSATMVFVMNHRSNLDYVLVTYLVARASALSYAVGEWARVWPLSALIRMMGAYFIRRRSRGMLYRRVLARYVQLATRGGVTQAMFPEGGLSLDGKPGKPKLGLLSYIVSDFDPGDRDVIFVPVALNYDRVIEDRILIAASEAGERRFRAPILQILRNVCAYLWARLRGRVDRFGEGVVSFGEPLSLSGFAQGKSTGSDAFTHTLGRELMARISAAVPVLPVPLVARAILDGARGAGIEDAVTALLETAGATGAPVPDRPVGEVVAEARKHLQQRRLISPDGEPAAASAPILAFYANSIAHHLATH